MSGFTIPARRMPERLPFAAPVKATGRRCILPAWLWGETARLRNQASLAAREAGEPWEPITHPKREEFC